MSDIESPAAVDAYLTLLREVLIGAVTRDPAHRIVPRSRDETAPPQSSDFDPVARHSGLDWPLTAFSMIGRRRMDNIRQLCTHALRNGIPGDFVETGVWRGGACIFMRGILRAFGETTRTVWVCDSFEGLPAPDPAYPADAGLDLQIYGQLAISQEEVADNFRRFDLLDEQVRFVRGWFKDTLPGAPIGAIAVLRLDGDLYQSTMDALSALYARVSPGGYVIVDDYHAFAACAQAVQDHLSRAEPQGVTLHEIDGTGVWWQKPG